MAVKILAMLLAQRQLVDLFIILKWILEGIVAVKDSSHASGSTTIGRPVYHIKMDFRGIIECTTLRLRIFGWSCNFRMEISSSLKFSERWLFLGKKLKDIQVNGIGWYDRKRDFLLLCSDRIICVSVRDGLITTLRLMTSQEDDTSQYTTLLTQVCKLSYPIIWDEVGESDTERGKMLLELERECLEVYKRKVDMENKSRAQLRQMIVDNETKLAAICSALGERPVHVRQFLESLNATLEVHYFWFSLSQLQLTVVVSSH
nr:65-kDa microtubule-associated protein 3-like [Tanacetum cinerariifolium]